jgi:hypothetical protein
MFLDEIAARLVSQGVGTINTNIFLTSASKIPTGAGPYLSVVDTGGAGSSGTQNNTATEYATASFTARAATYAAAYAMLKAAYTALGGANGLHNITLSGTFYLSLKARQNPTDLGIEDGTGRAMLVFNIEAEKQPS